MLNPAIFREYDIRGLVGEDLTGKSVELLGRAYGTFLVRHGLKKAIVGRDNRLSSYAYSRAMIEGLTGTGVDVIDIGMVTTPVFYFSRIKYGVEGGAMVTGSHNPPEYNGFKLAYGPDTLYGDGIQKIREIAESGEFEKGSGNVSAADPVPEYVADISSRIKLGPKKIRFAVDPGNGAAGPVAEKVFSSIGAEFEKIFFEPDGTFPNHHPDPTQIQNLKGLQHKVRREGLDIGIAFDGDADRLGVIDSTGRPIFGDELQVLFWKEILRKHPGALALIEVKCSQALVDAVEAMGGVPEFTRTGHSLIKAKMRERDALFTGEMSGHMFFKDEYYGFDDAIYAAARLLRLLSWSDETIEDMLKEVPKYYSTPEIRVFCPDDIKFRIVEELTSDFSRSYPVITVDGARVLFKDGWGLIRASNTQPALVLRAESRSPQGLSRIKKIFEDKLGVYSEVGQITWD